MILQDGRNFVTLKSTFYSALFWIFLNISQSWDMRSLDDRKVVKHGDGVLHLAVSRQQLSSGL